MTSAATKQFLPRSLGPRTLLFPVAELPVDLTGSCDSSRKGGGVSASWAAVSSRFQVGSPRGRPERIRTRDAWIGASGGRKNPFPSCLVGCDCEEKTDRVSLGRLKLEEQGAGIFPVLEELKAPACVDVPKERGAPEVVLLFHELESIMTSVKVLGPPAQSSPGTDFVFLWPCLGFPWKRFCFHPKGSTGSGQAEPSQPMGSSWTTSMLVVWVDVWGPWGRGLLQVSVWVFPGPQGDATPAPVKRWKCFR